MLQNVFGQIDTALTLLHHVWNGSLVVLPCGYTLAKLHKSAFKHAQEGVFSVCFQFQPQSAHAL